MQQQDNAVTNGEGKRRRSAVEVDGGSRTTKDPLTEATEPSDGGHPQKDPLTEATGPSHGGQSGPSYGGHRKNDMHMNSIERASPQERRASEDDDVDDDDQNDLAELIEDRPTPRSHFDIGANKD